MPRQASSRWAAAWPPPHFKLRSSIYELTRLGCFQVDFPSNYSCELSEFFLFFMGGGWRWTLVWTWLFSKHLFLFVCKYSILYTTCRWAPHEVHGEPYTEYSSGQPRAEAEGTLHLMLSKGAEADDRVEKWGPGGGGGTDAWSTFHGKFWVKKRRYK